MANLYELLKNPTSLFDSHAHINTVEYSLDIEQVINNSKANGVEQIFDIAIDIDSSKRSLELSTKYPEIKSFIGIDPEIFQPGSELFKGLKVNDSWFSQQYESLKQLITKSLDSQNNTGNIIGIGESGLDHYWIYKNESLDNETRERSKELQESLFRLHLDLAKEFNLPLTIHSRSAEERCLEIIRKGEYSDVVGIFHSYAGSVETGLKILERGWGLGINGIFTFKNALQMREIFRTIIKSRLNGDNIKDLRLPEDFYKIGIYFETDSPFLAPDPHRGTRNEPANTKLIFDRVVQELNS